MMDTWLQTFAEAGFRRSTDTAHDLKTPLNVAVLNLELLRMRARKVTEGADDEKLMTYARSIEVELRRMAQIFDTFFILSAPPKGEGAPQGVDASPICRDAAQAAGVTLSEFGPAVVHAHEQRIRQALKMFFDGAARALAAEGRTAEVETTGVFRVTVTGRPRADEFELSKIFKFYYTDPEGVPDLSLAAARLIAETYGGELIALSERDKVSLRLSLPLGER